MIFSLRLYREIRSSTSAMCLSDSSMVLIEDHIVVKVNAHEGQPVEDLVNRSLVRHWRVHQSERHNLECVSTELYTKVFNSLNRLDIKNCQ